MNFIRKALAAMSFTKPGSGWFFNLGPSSKVNYAKAVGDGLESNVLMSPILWIARAFPEAVLAVKTEGADGKNTIDRGHPLTQLVRRPNKFYGACVLWLATIISFLIDGNAYWFKVRGRAGRPSELWYVPHWLIEPKGDEKTFITHYEYRPNGIPIRIEPEDIIHFRYGLDPRNPQLGLAPLRAITKEVFSDDEAAGMVAALLRNKGIPGMVISPEKDVVIAPQDEVALKQYIQEKTTGEHRGEPMLLSAAVKVHTYGFSPSEMDLGAIRNIPEERVCAALGLPASVVGFGTGNEQTKVGATMKEQVRLAWTGGILPLLRMLSDQLTLQLLPDFDSNPRAEAFFDTAEVEALQADALAQAQALEIPVRSGIMTRGEARQKLGLETIPADEVFYIPFSAIETPRKERSAPPDPAPAEPPVKELKGRTKLTQRQARILRAQSVSAKRFREQLKDKMSDFFNRFGEAAEKAYLAAAARHTRVKAAEDELIISDIFTTMEVPKYRAEMRAIFGGTYVSVFNDTVGTLAGLGVGVNLPDSVQIDILSSGGTQAGLVDLTEAAKARTREILADAREQGLGAPETGRKLREAVPAGRFQDADYRAELIARTEIRNAQTQSSLMAYRSAEGVESVMIIDARLGETDDDCEAANGQVMGFDDAEGMLADEHPNGTRDLVPVFQEA